MIRILDDMVDSVGGFVNFILCFLLSSIMAFLIMVLLASVIALWEKVG